MRATRHARQRLPLLALGERRLPGEEVWLELGSSREVEEAIKDPQFAARDVFSRTVDWAVESGITTATFHIAFPPSTGLPGAGSVINLTGSYRCARAGLGYTPSGSARRSGRCVAARRA